MQNPEEYSKRRQQLLEKMGPNSIGIIAAAKEHIRNGDTHSPYRQNSDFYYLTGFMEPEAVAVFVPGRAAGEFILFNRARNPELEIWNGARAGQQGACEIFGADQAFPIEQLETEILKLLKNQQRLYYPLARDKCFDRKVLAWVAQLQTSARRSDNASLELMAIETILHEMRLIKSTMELNNLRKAAEISAAAHRRAMQVCEPGMREYRLEAEIQYVFTSQGSRAVAYNHIVGAGANSCVLHYTANQAQILDGDLVLIDAGAEYDYYAADITRTFPANGHFSEAQRLVYAAVLTTQLAVIEAVRPGVDWNFLNEVAQRIITEQLISIGLLSGDLPTLLAQKAYQRFFMHGIGHWLGLDVHDVGSYKVADKWRAFVPGMVLTVEPGIYIPVNSAGVDKKWWNIGIRIEDDVVVTHAGCDVLTAAVPKTIAEIEDLMAAR